MALSGLNDSKNELATTMAMGLLVTMLFFGMAAQRKHFVACGAAIGIGALQVYGTIEARSAGAVAASASAILVFLVLAVAGLAGRRTRLCVVLLIGFLASVLAVIYLAFNHQLVDWLSTTFGKSPTLTGRTYLWSRARELALARPIGGQGYAAFWQHGNLDAEGLWQYGHIASRQGFNFHSTFYDVLVALGWAGVALFALTLIVGLGRTALAYVRGATVWTAFWLSMGVFLIVRMPIETIGIYDFYCSTVLLFAMLGSASVSSEWRLSGLSRAHAAF